MLSLNNVKELKKQLQYCLEQCNEIIETRSNIPLFSSEKDYRHQSIAAQLLPEQYYNFRFFDIQISIRYNNRLKRYYIHIETQNRKYYEFFRSSEFKKTFNDIFEYDYQPRLSDVGYNIYFRSSFCDSFDIIVETFAKVVLYFCSKSFLTASLFEVY